MIVDAARYSNGRRIGGTLDLDELRTAVGARPQSDDDAPGSPTAASSGDDFVWIGLREPTEHDIAEVADLFGLPPLAVEDAVTAHQRSKVERYGDILFAILKPAEFVDGELRVGEVAVFVGAGFIVTVRHGIGEVVRQVRDGVDRGDPAVPFGPMSVLYELMDRVVDGYEIALERIGIEVDDVETLVFEPTEESHAEAVYRMKRTVAMLRRVLLPLGLPLQRLVAGGLVPLVQDLTHRFRDVHDHLQRATEELEAQDRLLSDVLQVDLAKLGVRQNELALQQNEDQRKMSAWAAIALLPTAVGGVYGMNFENMPELDWKYSYPVVLGLIALGCLALYRNFRRRGWL